MLFADDPDHKDRYLATIDGVACTGKDVYDLFVQDKHIEGRYGAEEASYTAMSLFGCAYNEDDNETFCIFTANYLDKEIGLRR